MSFDSIISYILCFDEPRIKNTPYFAILMSQESLVFNTFQREFTDKKVAFLRLRINESIKSPVFTNKNKNKFVKIHSL